MAVHNVQRGSYVKPSPHVVKSAVLPAPVNGMDARVPLASGDQLTSIYAYNLVPSEYGLSVRSGFREHQIDIVSTTGLGVHSVIPFESSDDNDVGDRLFAATNEGIWDVTDEGAAPILKYAFADTSAEAGYGTYANYIDDGGNELLFYADSLNGLLEYDSGADSWTPNTTITGVDPTTINFVVEHKLRIWFCVRDSTLGWYLPQNSRTGLAEQFNFGIHFKHGGRLVGLYNWTVDGGDGVDDFLVAVSSSGDVLPYQGVDPSSLNDWSIKGVYFIGAMAKGSRCASQYGGNTALLSSFGITEMSDLLRGVDPRLPNRDSIGAKIAPLIRRDMLTTRNENGWDIKYLESEGVIIVTSPIRTNDQYYQYVYNRSVGGWGIWRDVPITSIDVWKSKVYFGTEDNKVYVMDIERDFVTLEDPPPPEINGVPINFSLLHNYSTLDAPTSFKRGKLIRPDFIAQQQPVYETKFLYDYNVAELDQKSGSPESGLSYWDVDQWDSAVWGESSFKNNDVLFGGWGIGRTVSVAMRGNAYTRTTLAATDIAWDTGWFL